MTHHRWLRVALLLLALALTTAAGQLVALAQQESAAGPPALAPETEPNDSPWEADTLYGSSQGRINPVGDVDYYGFHTRCTGLDMEISTRLPARSPLQPRVTVLDADLNELASAVCTGGSPCITLRDVTTNNCFLRVEDAAGNGGPAYEYVLQALLLDPHEPNDFISEATPLTIGEPITGIIWPQGDTDVYVFAGEAGAEFVATSGLYSGLTLLNAEGEEIAYLYGYGDEFTLPATGAYYLQTGDTEANLTPYDLELRAIDRPWLFSFAGRGNLGGVAFEGGDILKYSPLNDAWQMYFDASDVGLRGNLVAFETDYYDNLFLVYATAQSVPGVGAIKPHDVLHFMASSTGPDTSGQLEMYVDGSDVGLTTAGESIDALGMSGYGDLLFSTKGNAQLPLKVGGLLIQNNDIVNLSLESSGADTQGRWGSVLDGATFGQPRANLIALDATDAGSEAHTFMLFDRAVTLGGVAFRVNDVIDCWRASDAGLCERYERAFDGALVSPQRIDALAVPPAEVH